MAKNVISSNIKFTFRRVSKAASQIGDLAKAVSIKLFQFTTNIPKKIRNQIRLLHKKIGPKKFFLKLMITYSGKKSVFFCRNDAYSFPKIL